MTPSQTVFGKMWFNAVLLIVSLQIVSSTASSIYHLSLNNKSKVFWTVDYLKNKVEFEVHTVLNTTEWFAIGFSNYGELHPSDLCVIWADWHRKIHFQDAWSDKNGTITVDNSQDCDHFKFNRKKDVIKFTFSRKFDSCDKDDYIIEEGTTHIVWASGKGPLYNLNGLNLKSKSASGFQRTRLLQNEDTQEQPSDVWELVLRNEQMKVPSVETTYWCRIVKLPSVFKRKHHVIKYEPAINKDHEHLIHHMEVFQCVADVSVVMPQYSGPCEGPKRPKATKVCKHVLAAWAMGATAFSYPEDAGLSIGGENFNPYVMVEVHYHNPDLHSGVMDNSGIRFYLTEKLRKFDAGVMELGLEYTDKMAIPPGQRKFLLSGYCIKECTAVSLPENGITVFGSQLHTHLTGTRVYTKHVRGGVELPELNRDNHYSSHFQEIRRLKKPVHVLPGDALITTCEYKTTDRQNVTLGGFSITDEMCVNYIHYYPRTDLELCKSAISEEDLASYFNYMAEWESQDTSRAQGISQKYGAIKWTRSRVVALQQLYEESQLSMQCNQSSGERFPGMWEGVFNTQIKLPLLPKPRKCKHF